MGDSRTLVGSLGGDGSGGVPSVPSGPITHLQSEVLPEPTAARLREVHNHNGQLFRCVGHEGTPPAVAFDTTYTSGDDVSSLWGEADGTYRYRGRSWASSVADPVVGDVVLLPDGVFRRRTATNWVALTSPDGWLGIFSTEELAKAAVTALNDVVSFANDLQLVTAYVAAGDPAYTWELETQASNVPIDSRDFAGNLAIADDTVQKVAEKVDTLVVTGGGNGNGGGDDAPSETVTVGPYTDVQTWDRGDALVDGRMYRAGVQPDTTKEFMHIGLLIEGSVPKTLVYNRIRTAEWLTLKLDILASDNTPFNEDEEESGVLSYATNDRYNVISLHLRRYQDADGNNLLACGIQVNTPGDQPSSNVHGLLYFYEDKSLEVEFTGSAAGSGLTPKTFADATEPVEESVGLIENIEGVLYEHDRRHLEGHGKTIGGTASPGTWITLNDDDFLGFFTHVDPPPDTVFTSGKFYYGRDYGSFTIHRVNGEDGWLGVTGNFTYDPFADGEPWHEVTIAGAEVDLNFRGGVDHLRLAFAAANGIGEAFANRGANEMVYASEFMAQTDGYDEFFRRVYIPPGAVRPIMEFWGEGQTKQFAANVIAHARTGGLYYRYAWVQENPNHAIGYDFGVRAVDATDVIGVDLLTGEAALGNQKVLKFPPGSYRLNFQANHNAPTDVSLGAWLFCVTSMTDEIKGYYTSGYAGRQSPPGITQATSQQYGQSIVLNLNVHFSVESFITIIAGTLADDAQAAGSHSIVIEKLE